MYKIRFFAGITIVVVGLILSFRQYNYPRFHSVHEFMIQCHMRSDHFVEVYGNSGLGGLDWCLHNTGLSLVLFTMLGVGIFLIYKSKKYQ